MRIAIIGGGAAGLAAAIGAARARTDDQDEIMILEKMDRVGRKILATGNGRCNISNEDMGVSHYHPDPAFVEKVFTQVTPADVLEFWESLGLELVSEEGRLYPASLQASAVLDALRAEAERLGVRTACETPVDQIVPGKKGFRLVSQGRDLGRFHRVIITAGGKASPQFGADGDGIKLAAGLHHGYAGLRPALVRLKCRNPYLKSLAGCKIQAGARLSISGHTVQTGAGEILFTAEGLSGPPILDLSREALAPGAEAVIHLNLEPGMREGECFWWLQQRCTRFPYMNLPAMLAGILNKRLIGPLLKSCGLGDIPCGSVSKPQVQKLAKLLQDWEFPVIGDAGWREAQVTVGGVLTEEVDPATMESIKCPGIFWAGEVLNIDGDCGGYNLHWAAASGLLAGHTAALPNDKD